MASSKALTDTLMFFSRLAWNCRISLPLFVMISFMALDFRMQIEINVETQRIRRVHLFDEEDENGEYFSSSEEDDDYQSWETISSESQTTDATPEL